MRDNKGRFVKGWTPPTAFKKGDPRIMGKNHPLWKGDEAGYYAIHIWLSAHYGKPKECKFCGETEKIQWANKNGIYNRERKNWLNLCYWCHRKYDKENGWNKVDLKFKDYHKHKLDRKRQYHLEKSKFI